MDNKIILSRLIAQKFNEKPFISDRKLSIEKLPHFQNCWLTFDILFKDKSKVRRATHVAKQEKYIHWSVGKADRIVVIKSNLFRNSGICAGIYL